MRLATDLVFVSLLVVACVTDLRRRLIPNRLLLSGVAVGLPLLALADPGGLSARIAAMAAAGPFLAVALVRPDGFGMGDVKLIATMGLFLGGAVLGAIVVALCAASSLGLGLLVRDGRAATKATFPLAPFLALGGLLALLGWIPALQ
ncbi:MAG: prepilin peptidase [Actinobacteria bacterium]|nr:prepilin peptidase [Actinomycetota bacterium]